MSPFRDRRTHSFILRLWVEPTQESQAPVWRGQVKYVGSDAVHHFQPHPAMLAVLLELVQENIDASDKEM